MPAARQTAAATAAERSAAGGAKTEMLKQDAKLAYRLSLLSFIVNKSTAKVYNGFGLSMHEWKVMSVLNAHAPMTGQAITQWVTLDKAAISRAIQLLLRKKLVQRKLTGFDARTVQINMTARGRSIYGTIARHTAALQADLVHDVSEADLRTLFKVLRQVEGRVRARQDKARESSDAR
jgi:DNA-binding MarR family transcriptional regulator